MHEATTVGPWGPRGLQRHVRSTVATGLAAMAAVLSAASTVAETIAKELRLSLDEEVELPPRRDDGPRRAQPVADHRVEPDGDAEGPTVRIVDAAQRVDRRTDAGAPDTDVSPAEGGPSPWVNDVAADVASGTVRDAVERLPSLTPTQLRALERHERENRQRVTLLRAVGEELTRRG